MSYDICFDQIFNLLEYLTISMTNASRASSLHPILEC